jgi:hypothetical protein
VSEELTEGEDSKISLWIKWIFTTEGNLLGVYLSTLRPGLSLQDFVEIGDRIHKLCQP